MKTWLITGCSTGIGRGIAKAVLQSGDQAVVTARDVSTLRAFAEKYPDTCLTLPLDLTDWTSMDTAVRKAVARFGRIDVLVNNAGYGCRAAIEESEDGEIARLFFRIKKSLPKQRLSIKIEIPHDPVHGRPGPAR